jgi:hypothetical protein
MTIAGNWILHYSWGCSSTYGQTSIIFNGDGTFTGPYTGKWRQQSGTLMLSFDGGPAKYGGTVNGSVGSGVMSTFSGLDGCWYLSMQGTTGIIPEGAAVAEEAALPAGPDGSTIAPREPAPEAGELVGAGGRGTRKRSSKSASGRTK